MQRHSQTGFSLMEMVIALVLVGILAGIAAPYMSNGVQAYNATSAGLQTVDKLRYASERIARELREIQRNGSGNFAISTPVNVSGDSISFTKTDGDTVTVSAAAPTLNLSYAALNGDTPYVLTDQLTGITFSYYQNDGSSAATNTGDVAYIEFEIVLNNGSSYSQRSRVALRNQP